MPLSTALQLLAQVVNTPLVQLLILDRANRTDLRVGSPQFSLRVQNRVDMQS